MKKFLLLVVSFLCLTLAGSATTVENPSFAELNSELEKLVGRLDNIQRQQEEVKHGLDQIHISGQGLAIMRQLEVTGQGKDRAVDFLGRHLWYDAVEGEKQFQGSKANQRVDLTIIGKALPQIEVRSDLKANVIWMVPNEVTKLKMDNFSIRTNFGSWKSQVGSFDTAFSPLTLYYPRYYAGFESELFSQQRNLWYEDLDMTQAPARRLEGIYSQYALGSFRVRGLLSRLRPQRYLFGAQTTVSPREDLLFGVNWVALKDDPYGPGGMFSDLFGLTALFNPKAHVTVSGEYVRSRYDDNIKSGLSFSFDHALVGELNWEGKQTKLSLATIDVGQNYYAPAAQSRSWRLEDNSLFGAADSITAMDGRNSDAILEALPYGLATPNRSGYKVGFAWEGNWLKGIFERIDLKEKHAAVDNWDPTNSFATRRKYTVEKLGGELDFTRIIKTGNMLLPQRPILIRAQVENRGTIRDDDPNTEPLEVILQKSKIYDLGLTYELSPRWSLLLGTKKILNHGEVGLQIKDEVHKTQMVGFKVAISKLTTAQLSWQNTNYEDKTDTNDNFQGQNLAFSVKASF